MEQHLKFEKSVLVAERRRLADGWTVYTTDLDRIILGKPIMHTADEDLVTSYADGYERALMIAEEEGIEDLDEFLLDHNVEKCPGCEWYVESGELIPPDEDDPDGFCENCRSS